MPESVYLTFDQANLDREYSPSSRVDDINVFLDMYVNLSAAAKREALAQELCEPDVSYGERPEETLDMFWPRKAELPPLHVYIHGGYWQLLSKDESCFAAPLFQEFGSCFAAVNYTLAPDQTLTGIVEENRRAIAFLYRNAERWGYDRNRIYLSGSSAGAHLAIMMLLTDWRSMGLPADTIKGVCAVSGVYDLEPVRLTYVNDAVGMDADEAAANSPILHPLRNRCPVILAYGDNETDEFKRQTQDYRSRLRSNDIDVVFSEIGDRNHFDVIVDLADSDSWLSREVRRQMDLPAAMSG